MGRRSRTQRRREREQPGRSAQDFEGSTLQTALVAVVVAKVFAMALVFDTASAQMFDIPKLAASRIGAWVLAGLLVMAVIRHGVRVIPRTPFHFAVGGFVIAALISLAFAADRYIGLFGEQGSYLGLATYLDMAVLYLAAAVAIRTRRDRRTIAVAVVILGTLLLGYALLQRLDLDPWDWGEAYLTRPMATLGNATLLEQLLAAIFGLGLAIAVLHPDEEARGRVRLASAAIAVGALTLVALSGGRSALIGAAAAAAVVLVVWARLAIRARSFDRRVVGVGAAALILVVAVLALSPAGSRAAQTLSGGAIRDRQLIFDIALKAAQERPLTGYGPDAFSIAVPRYRQAESTAVFSLTSEVSAHSWLLHLAATLGVGGVAAMVAAIALLTVTAWRRLPSDPAEAAGLLAFAAAFFVAGLFTIDSIGTLWAPWLAFGVAAGLGATYPTAPARRAPQWLLLAPLLLAAAGAVAALSLVSVSRDMAVARGQGPGSVAGAAAAVRRDPGRADHWNTLGLAHTLSQSWKEAGDAFAQAADRSPHRVTYWANLARARIAQAQARDLRSGGLDAAHAAAERAASTDPNDPEGHIALALSHNASGRHEQARQAIRRAVDLGGTSPAFDQEITGIVLSDPGVSEARTLVLELLASYPRRDLQLAAAQLAIRAGDRADAVTRLRAILAQNPHDGDAQALLDQLAR